jgi:proton-dependent oligopeptide transporter, POT family
VLLLVPAYGLQAAPGIKVAPLWPVGGYFIQELGEMCLSPVGLSVFTKMSPVKIVGTALRRWTGADTRQGATIKWAGRIAAWPAPAR